MPSQLQRRLERFLDPRVARTINALAAVPQVDVPAAPSKAQLLNLAVEPPRNTRAHWGNTTFGTVMQNIQSVTIHGTSGWPSYASADNFRVVFDSTGEYKAVPVAHPTHWYCKRAIGPQYFVEPNGTIYPLIGPETLEGDAQFTWHSEMMSFLSLGIENADGGDESAIATTATAFHRLDTTAAAAAADLAGMQLFGLLHPGGNQEDLNLIWFAMAASYTGPGDIARPAADHRYDGWRNTLFTERDYRSLALLCRFLAERNGIPRNFPLLPFASVKHDAADPAVFRKILLADPLADQIGAQLTVNMTDARAGSAAFTQAYAPKHAEWWGRLFGLTPAGGRSTPCFRGFISHMINGHHPCPGPLFDWHRFAREVWDWWWYPFDFVAASDPRELWTSVRPYRKARGDTPLVEYYFDAGGTDVDYNARKVALSVADRFTLAADVPVYALANGVAIAAQLPHNSDPNSPGFLLTRHEVFHTSATVPAARIDYDQAPTYVWSLVSFVTAPGMSLDQVGDANPDWLNRFVIRLKETELAVRFHTANPAMAALTRGWGHRPAAPTPPSAVVRRPTTGTAIERDAAAYRLIANDLGAGKPVLFPLADDNDVTPVTVLLGDYLGIAGTLPGGALGVQVEIFSNEKLDIPGATARAVSAAGESWWADASGPTRLERSATELPANGVTWQYAMTNFLQWINGVTWASEWPKYGARDLHNAPLSLPPRPNSRIIL